MATDGKLILDKVTWFGETGPFIELLLKDRYPALGKKEMALAWAAHVEDGAAAFNNIKSLCDLTELY